VENTAKIVQLSFDKQRKLKFFSSISRGVINFKSKSVFDLDIKVFANLDFWDIISKSISSLSKDNLCLWSEFLSCLLGKIFDTFTNTGILI